MTTNDARDPIWDAVRGMGIVTVVLGHMEIASKLIYSFHMPLFFFLGGVLYKRRKVGELLYYIVSRMLIPYLIWAVGLSVAAHLAYQVLGIGSEEQFGNLKSEFLNILLGGGPNNTINACPAIWYLVALAIVTSLYVCIDRINIKYLRTLCVALCAIVGVVLSQKGYMGSFNIVVALLVMPFYHMGRYFRTVEKKVLQGKRLYLVGCVCLLCWIVLYKYNGTVHIYRGILGNNSLLFYIIALLGSVTCICVMKYIVSKQWLHPVSFFFQYLGKASLGIMCVHMVLIYVLKAFIGNSVVLFLTVLSGSFLIAMVWEWIYSKSIKVIQLKHW